MVRPPLINHSRQDAEYLKEGVALLTIRPNLPDYVQHEHQALEAEGLGWHRYQYVVCH
jgi:hypothetical protein